MVNLEALDAAHAAAMAVLSELKAACVAQCGPFQQAGDVDGEIAAHADHKEALEEAYRGFAEASERRVAGQEIALAQRLAAKHGLSVKED